jgi:hypothetical protein
MMSITIVFVNLFWLLWQKAKPLTILGLGTAHRPDSLNKRRHSEPLRAAAPQPGAGVLTVTVDCKRNRDVLIQYL